MESCFRLNDPLHNARLAIASDSHYIILANQSQERCVYICVCNAIRESDLRRVARCVPGDAEACYAALGKRPNCGSCLDEADEIVDDERANCFQPACAA